jgi:hypothetical protein
LAVQYGVANDPLGAGLKLSGASGGGGRYFAAAGCIGHPMGGSWKDCFWLDRNANSRLFRLFYGPFLSSKRFRSYGFITKTA